MAADANGNTKRKNDEIDCSLNKLFKHSYDVKAFVVECKGERDEMQDYYVIYDDFNKIVWPLEAERKNEPVFRYYAIFDGHGGKKASNYASKVLANIIAEKLSSVQSEDDVHKGIKRIIYEAFKKVDEDFLKEAAKCKPPWNDGSTATVLLMVNEVIYISNIGDSMAVLARMNPENEKLKAIELTENHVPSIYEERVRIQKCGGKVLDGRVNGILEVSRSFGDGRLKKLGVSSVPNMKRCKMQPQNDKFIVLACDGLWKTYNAQLAIETVHSIINDNILGGKTLNQAYEMACLTIAQKSLKSLCGDNVTVILIRLQA